jgi:hypothetical protein
MAITVTAPAIMHPVAMDKRPEFTPSFLRFGRSESVPPFGSDPSRVIARALFDARRRGLDDVSQSRYAVATVLAVRPDMTASDAAKSVEWVRTGRR